MLIAYFFALLEEEYCYAPFLKTTLHVTPKNPNFLNLTYSRFY